MTTLQTLKFVPVPVLRINIPTMRASLTGVRRIEEHNRTTVEFPVFMSDELSELTKRPLLGSSPSLLPFLRCFPTTESRAAISNVCEVLHHNDRIGVAGDDCFGQNMQGVHNKQSFSFAHFSDVSFGGTSAFGHKFSPQLTIARLDSCIVIWEIQNLPATTGRNDASDVAFAHIDGCDLLLNLVFWDFDRDWHDQIKSLLFRIKPQFGIAHSARLQGFDVVGMSGEWDVFDPVIQCSDVDLLRIWEN